mmetsp:Transcript_20197/g.38000  ORF Transcript_20197/g.38000 Transcript_20197/m.38000 type:complete len:429 (-) Transcript_20197:139-1425(-)|eukprot:CAMPEP_0170182772 /NCGR_PEP_ID=MMETSP0040_2-20121228/28804_1 /TAXON_ID=641309 /ORGANISM="Lotharella oceanica, Strain CCMP622" /LENGTH=428 /DNA_ID=CAMNT_0010428309 /DNA_START=15 /DNA_END=1301 /DNA_ORIENTATION=+
MSINGPSGSFDDDANGKQWRCTCTRLKLILQNLGLKRFDAFPTPSSMIKSNVGGCCTFALVASLIALLILTLISTLHSSKLVTFTNYPASIDVADDLPELLLQVKSQFDGFHRGLLNVTYGQWTVYASDTDPTRPRKFEDIPVEYWEIKGGNGNAIKGFRPIRPGQMRASFSDDVYQFTTFSIGLNESADPAEASKVAQEYTTVSLWAHEVIVRGGRQDWHDVVYVNYEDDTWLGIDTSFRKVDLVEHHMIGSTKSQAVAFDTFNVRRSRSKPNEFMRFYHKSSFLRTKYEQSPSNTAMTLPLLHLMGFLGGVATVLFAMFGGIVELYNSLVAEKLNSRRTETARDLIRTEAGKALIRELDDIKALQRVPSLAGESSRQPSHSVTRDRNTSAASGVFYQKMEDGHRQLDKAVDSKETDKEKHVPFAFE